jgi:hypothetical protein
MPLSEYRELYLAIDSSSEPIDDDAQNSPLLKRSVNRVLWLRRFSCAKYQLANLKRGGARHRVGAV